ncbi:MAG: VPLPA-CTERM sorting domain-containing protein [Rhodobacteraceae bacterium]|nr:VPLPA-CTERM sorting domain-containing protein [Paracoccaceae bacterium]
MKKYVLACGLALASLGFGTASNAAVISSGQISLNGSTLSLSGLTAGNQYFLTVSGSGVIAGDGRLADAEYFQGAVGDAVWIDQRSGGPEIGVFVDGLDVNWGAFNPANVYQIIYNATSDSVSLFFNDSFYDDNNPEGFLTASISAVPLPASMLGLLAGLAGLGFLRRRKTA